MKKQQPWGLFRFCVLVSTVFFLPFLASTQSIRNTSHTVSGSAIDGSGTTNIVSKWIDSDTLGNSNFNDDGTTAGVFGTSITFKGAAVVGNGGGFFNINNTLPAAPGANINGVHWRFSGAGSDSFIRSGLKLDANYTYTGSSDTYGAQINNESNASTGNDIGLLVTSNNSTNKRIGLYATADTTGGGTGDYAYGVVGNPGDHATNYAGIVGFLGTGDIPASSGKVAGYFDNEAVLAAILCAADNNVLKFCIDDGGMIQLRNPHAFTVADSGTGSAATGTLTPTHSYVEVTCNDADGCNITMGETGILEGHIVKIINVSANAANFADTAGVSELEGAFAAGQYDSLTLIYIGDRWIEESRKNN